MKALWITVGGLGALLAIAGLGRSLWALRPQYRSENLPPTQMEKKAWVGLVISTIVGGGLAAIVAIGGAVAFHEDAAYRLSFWALVVGGVIAWFAISAAMNRRSGGMVIDERDRAILARSLSIESIVVLVSLVAWTVVLTEIFWDDGSVPLEYLQLLFWSTWISGIFGRALGVLLGYRQETVSNA